MCSEKVFFLPSHGIADLLAEASRSESPRHWATSTPWVSRPRTRRPSSSTGPASAVAKRSSSGSGESRWNLPMSGLSYPLTQGQQGRTGPWSCRGAPRLPEGAELLFWASCGGFSEQGPHGPPKIGCFLWFRNPQPKERGPPIDSF